MQTILLPVDFSPASRNAAIYAAEIARLLNTRLLLFHAYLMPTPISEVPYAMITVDNLQKENEDQIRKEANFLKTEYGVEAEWLVRIGTASDEIKVITREQSIGLIIMGMKGAGGLDKIIGSTTTNVTRKVKTPVLVVPHDASYQPISHITYASDFSYPASVQLFDPMLELARASKASINILHIRLHHTGASQQETDGKKDKAALFEGYSHEYHIIEEASVNQGINNFLQDHASELLVMVAHKHSFLERIFSKNHTTSMLYETHTPLLILQDKG